MFAKMSASPCCQQFAKRFGREHFAPYGKQLQYLSQGSGYNYHQCTWKLPNDSLRQVSGLQPWQYQCDFAQNRPYSTIVAPSL